MTAQITLFNDHVEGLEHIFDQLLQLRPCAFHIVDLEIFLLDLHLTKLRLYVVLKQLARAPNYLDELFLLFAHRLVVIF